MALNPSAQIRSARSSLGLNLLLEVRPVDWDSLAACGAPLTAQGKRQLQPSAELLLQSLRLACRHLEEVQALHSREGLAVRALLLALRLHFPAFYSKHCARSPLLSRICPESPSGPMIKLKRIAVATLATYL